MNLKHTDSIALNPEPPLATTNIIALPVEVIAILVGLVAAVFRVWKLSFVPGLYGDEAWYGTVCELILRHEPFPWRTPNGNPLNPFLFLPLLTLHALFKPSVLLLRCVPAFCGAAAIVLNAILCRRAFGTRIALGSTLLLACLPEAIAESRFCWDPAQSLLIDAAVFYFSALIVKETPHSIRMLRWSLLALVAGALIHPTNIFGGLFILIAALQR